MPLAPGTRIGPYEILAPLGAGGMGEVWRARDPRLARDVAIKALPDAFARDPERVARFEREARLLAALNHPHIAGILGLEEAAGRRYLVLEYVEGVTLAERLAKGALPVAEALDLCRQIAAGVESAHEAGIVHRDLKPGNVKITPAGEVKVLDFGLAKGAAARGGAASDLSASPTVTHAETGQGVILGTAAYMSPEQARGKPVDRRTDIWSFGCVLYECLAGRRLHDGETLSDVVAKILEREPEWSALPATTPPHVRDLLQRCLEKDARRRLRDIGEARLALEGGATVSGIRRAEAPAAAARRGLPAWLPWALAALMGALAAAAFVARPPAPGGAEATRLVVLPPPGHRPDADASSMALSPDGRTLAFCAADSTGRMALWVRPLGSFEARPLPGTAGASQPFWAPGGRDLGFFAAGKLRRVALDGGRVSDVCDAPNGRGGAWSERGEIVFAPAGGGPLFRVSEDGGEPLQATRLDSTHGETAHRFPCVLPGGRHVMYVVLPRVREAMRVVVAPLDGGPAADLLTADGAAVYASGHLLFARNGRVHAQPFDARSRRLSGRAVPLEEEPGASSVSGAPLFAAAGRTIAFSSSTPNSWLEWFDAQMRPAGRAAVPPGRYDSPAFWPDGRTLLVTREEKQGRSDLWSFDLEREVLTRLTSGPAINQMGVVSPDGRRVVFRSDRNGRFDLYVKDVASGAPESLAVASPSTFSEPFDWSRDGRLLAYAVLDPATGWDLWVLPMDGGGPARPALRTRFNERYPAFSPDGRWLCYASDESGRDEIHVRSFPDGGVVRRVSTRGGIAPRWRSDGRQIMFPDGGANIEAVDVTPGADLRIGVPRVLGRMPRGTFGGSPLPDFSRLLFTVAEARDDAGAYRVVLDWPAALARR